MMQVKISTRKIMSMLITAVTVLMMRVLMSLRKNNDDNNASNDIADAVMIK